MLKNLVDKRNLIMFILAGALLVLWLLHLIFGNEEGKVMLLVFSLLMPFVIYGLVRLMYRIIKVNASEMAMLFFFHFFLILGAVSLVMMTVEFVMWFPNGLTVTFGICEALIIATLDEAKKILEIKSKD